MEKNKKKIMITGASGFIGRNLVENFKKKYLVLAPLREELNLVDERSVCGYLKKNLPDVVLHAAIVGGSRDEEQKDNMFFINLKMFFNLVRNRNYFGKLIQIGSGAEYDKRRSLRKVKEENFDDFVPNDNYGFFKYICAKYIETADDIINLRVFGLFGKYEDFRYRFISNAICRNLKGLPITISQDVFFDYVFIDDFVKIMDYFINNHPRFKSYNIGTGDPINLVNIAKRINNQSQKKSKIEVLKRGFKKEYTCSNNRLISEIGKFNFSDFNRSLSMLRKWYEDRIESIEPSNL